MFEMSHMVEIMDFRWPGSDGSPVPDERDGPALSQSGAA